MRWPLVMLGALLACERDPRSPAAEGNVACTRDEECRMPVCGPCLAGSVITHEKLEQSCAVNPCPQAAAQCNEDRVCAVKCVACGGAKP